jgi:tellurite resistance protein TerC
MGSVMDLGAVFIILQLIYLEGILSIDNAAVLGAMVAHLPRDDPVPWPRLLRFLRTPVHRILGGQRLAALKVGLLGAYLGRGTMLLIASWVVRNRWLLLVGGLYLIKLAVDHLGVTPQEARDEAAAAAGHPVRRTGAGFWSVVVAVELADLAFSLDNVVAAVALSRNIYIIWTGVFIGIITMRFAAGIFVRLIDRLPELEAAAYLLVLNIGILLLLEDFFHIHPADVQKFLMSLSIIAATVLWGRVPALRRAGRSLRWVSRALGVVSVVFAAALRPVAWVAAGLLAVGRGVAGLWPARQSAEPGRAPGDR